MQCVILAAGRGVRMGDMTQEMPKPLIPIAGQSILDRTLAELPPQIDEVIFVVGYLGNQIRHKFGEQFGRFRIRYVQQTERHGTGHALKLCQEYLTGKFLVLMADDLYCCDDLARCLEHDLCLLACQKKYEGKGGVLKLASDGHLLEVLESPAVPPSDLMNTGTYVLDTRFFDYPLVSYQNHDGKTEYGLPQTVALMAKDLPVYIEKATRWFAVTRPEDISKAAGWLEKSNC
jgi:NDP-sugar pyrophosphorylase family protein